jgi:hypothetical protein
VAGTTCDKAPSHDGGSIVGILLKSGKSHEIEIGRATRGKWRIPDGKSSEWCVFRFGASKVVAPPPESIKDRVA